jgi:L-ascorbate metabolism protein UlaG (beta-lactamase superfamily)
VHDPDFNGLCGLNAKTHSHGDHGGGQGERFYKGTTVHIFTPEKESCAKTSVTARTQKKVTSVSGEQKECQVAEAGFKRVRREDLRETTQNGTALHCNNAAL